MGEIIASPARRCLNGVVGCHYPAPHDHVAGAVYPHPATCDCCRCISGARIEGGQLVMGGKDAPEAALRARIAALESLVIEYAVALDERVQLLDGECKLRDPRVLASITRWSNAHKALLARGRELAEEPQ